MYHPSGILILGAEDSLNSADGLYKSHAEEYAAASEAFKIRLPPYDEFARGWIGVGGAYPSGIIHFAPQINDCYMPHFLAAFAFIEEVQKNGFTENTILLGFCDRWEQPISRIINRGRSSESLDDRIQSARAKRISCAFSDRSYRQHRR